MGSEIREVAPLCRHCRATGRQAHVPQQVRMRRARRERRSGVGFYGLGVQDRLPSVTAVFTTPFTLDSVEQAMLRTLRAPPPSVMGVRMNETFMRTMTSINLPGPGEAGLGVERRSVEPV